MNHMQTLALAVIAAALCVIATNMTLENASKMQGSSNVEMASEAQFIGLVFMLSEQEDRMSSALLIQNSSGQLELIHSQTDISVKDDDDVYLYRRAVQGPIRTFELPPRG